MKEKMICRGDLFYYDFGDNSGSVQSGGRPVLVVQADDYNQNAPTIIVAAVTSVIKKRYLPSHIILGEEFGLKKPSMVLLEQIRTCCLRMPSDEIVPTGPFPYSLPSAYSKLHHDLSLPDNLHKEKQLVFLQIIV